MGKKNVGRPALAALVILGIAGSLAGCSRAGGDASAARDTFWDKPEDGDDESIVEDLGNKDGELLDLTEMNSTMVYSEVFAMMNYPEQYEGTRVRMEGSLSLNDVPGGAGSGGIRAETACIVQDALGCCRQGIAFENADFAKSSEARDGTEIIVEGVFTVEDRDGAVCCVIRDAEVTVV